MFNSQASRISFYFFLLLASLLMAVVGQWAFGGIVGGIVLFFAVAAHVVATLSAPHLVWRQDIRDDLALLAFAFVVGLATGIITFGWWGIAYGVGTIAGFLLSKTTRS